MQQKLQEARVRSSKGEEGFVLLMMLFFVALIVIALALAAPKWKQQIQRDQELELKHRGMQYARAVKLYYKKYGAYPTTLQQLLTGSQVGGTTLGFGGGTSPGQQRFLRRLYADPITGKPAWRPVYFGQIGMFSGDVNCGQNGSTAMTGSLATQTQQNQASGTPTPPTLGPGAIATAAGTGDCSGTGSSSGFGSSPGGLGSSPGGLGSNSPGGFGSSSVGPTSGFGSSGSPSAFGTSGGFGSPTPGDPNSSGTGFGNPAFGSAGPIVGVASLSPKESIMEIKGKNHYNQLEFVYDPTQDFAGSGGLNGTSVGGAATPSGPLTNSPGFGSSSSQPGGIFSGGNQNPGGSNNPGSSGSDSGGSNSGGSSNNPGGNNPSNPTQPNQ